MIPLSYFNFLCLLILCIVDHSFTPPSVYSPSFICLRIYQLSLYEFSNYLSSTYLCILLVLFSQWILTNKAFYSIKAAFLKFSRYCSSFEWINMLELHLKFSSLTKPRCGQFFSPLKNPWIVLSREIDVCVIH